MPLTWGEGDIWHGELQAEGGCALVSNFDRGPCTEQQLHVWHELGWLAQRSVAWGEAWGFFFGRPLEYKYVVRRGAEVSEWQPGENLVVDVPREPAVLYIEDKWLNEVDSCWTADVSYPPHLCISITQLERTMLWSLHPSNVLLCTVQRRAAVNVQERSVQMQTASSGLQASQASQPSGGEVAQPAPTATDKAAQATAAASANSPAAAAQQPMAAEPESEDAAVAAQRSNRYCAS